MTHMQDELGAYPDDSTFGGIGGEAARRRAQRRSNTLEKRLEKEGVKLLREADRTDSAVREYRKSYDALIEARKGMVQPPG